jgi:hypothetical protein
MSDTVTYGHPTPAGPDILTINQAGYLADLIRGVERGKRMRWYPLGAGSVDHPLTVTLRAFTNPDGSLYPYAADIRDAHVWTSGMFEHWYPVRDILAALDNAISGTEENSPMALIEDLAG